MKIGDQLDIKDLRRMNLVGTVFFALFGGMVVYGYFYSAYRMQKEFPDYYDLSSNMRIIIIWLLIIVIFTFLLYKFTVKGLDRGNYKAAKRFTLVGIIVGIAGGVIPTIIFIKSYVSFDDAIKHRKTNM